jgi:hypothetical protein
VLARFTPEQLIERHVQSFALDIPQRQVDGAKCVQSFLAGRVEPVHEHRLPNHLGIERVLADDASGNVPHRIGRSALTDAGDPGVGVDEDNHVALRKSLGPIPVVVQGVEDADFGDFRRWKPALRTRQGSRRALRGCCHYFLTGDKRANDAGKRFGKAPSIEIHTLSLSQS